MNAEDLALFRSLATRAADVVERVKALAHFPPVGDVGDLEQLLDDLSRDVGQAVCQVMQRETVSWGRTRHAPRHHAPRRMVAPPAQSKDLVPNAVIPRYRMDGSRQGESSTRAPQLDGRWAQWRGQKPEGA